MNRYYKFGFSSADRFEIREGYKAKGKPFEKLKIYDVTNHIHKLINEVLNNLVSQGGGIPKIDDPLYRPNLNDLKKDFKKFILAQICTFKRDHSNTFIEEYIPAQILTEALRINGYNGVKFPSTQFYGKNITNKSILHPSAVQENIAIFTKYSNSNPFDLDLMKYFFVTPLDNTIAKSKSVEEYKKEFVELQNEITMGCYSNLNNLNNSITKASMNIGKVHACEIDLKIDDIPYFNLDFAKLELLAQSNYLRQIKNQTEHFSNGRQTMFPIK